MDFLPFETQFGWHIVRLEERHPAKPFEEVQADFETRIRKDDRSKLITASMNEKLRAINMNQTITAFA